MAVFQAGGNEGCRFWRQRGGCCGVALAVWLALAGAPERARADDGSDIRAVIALQIAAFQNDDAEAAFAHASPTIQRLFGNPANFGRMVERGYPMIWRPGDVSFLGLRNERGRLLQRVMVRDGAGALFVFDYEMVASPEGWRINGVFLLQYGLASA